MTPTQDKISFYWPELPAGRLLSSKLAQGKPASRFKWVRTISMSDEGRREREAKNERQSAFEADAELRDERAGEGLEHLDYEGHENGQIAGDPFRRLTVGYQELTARRPLDAQAHFQFGRQFLQVKMFDWALTAFKRALEIAPQWADARYYHANALFAAGKLDEAEAEYDQARKLDPTMFEASVEQELLRIKRARAQQNGKTSGDTV